MEKELKELLKASEEFWRYVNQYSDPVLNEPSVIRLKKAQKAARQVLKGVK